jgi:transporter family-2 protein
MSPLASLLGLLIAGAAGAVVPVQAGANAALGRALGHPLWATLISLAVSVLAILPVMLVQRVPAPQLALAAKGPLWWWIGGVLGVFYISSALILAPKLGVSNFIAAVVAGQMVASLLLDHYALAGFAARPITMMKLVGALMIVAGVVVMQNAPAGDSGLGRVAVRGR